MEMKDMLSTGAMLIIGIIALKAFGGVKGITSMIGGIGDLLGTGTAAAAPAVGIIAPETAAQVELIGGMSPSEVTLVAETQKIESIYDIINKLGWVGGPMWAAAMPHITAPFEDIAKADLLGAFVSELPRWTPSPALTEPREVIPVATIQTPLTQQPVMVTEDVFVWGGERIGL